MSLSEELSAIARRHEHETVPTGKVRGIAIEVERALDAVREARCSAYAHKGVPDAVAVRTYRAEQAVLDLRATVLDALAGKHEPTTGERPRIKLGG